MSKRYLTALESGQFNILPGGVINKGIVRSYARVVGLKEEKWVNHFMAAYSQSDQLTDDDASWIAFAENVKKGRPAKSDAPTLRLRWTGAAVIVVLLVTLGWLVWHFTGNKATAQAYMPQPAVTMLVIGAGSSSPVPSHR